MRSTFSPDRRARARLARALLPLLVALAPLACGHAPASPPARASGAQGERCPGGIDYGSGMVAAVLPPALMEALERAHAYVLAAAPAQRSDFLADAPYAPHVSVIYGVTDARRPAVLERLDALAPQSPPATLALGELVYWDDPRGQKTTLVVQVLDGRQTLACLHARIGAYAQIASRFAYHPHVTVAYLQLGARLAPATQARLQDMLAGTRAEAAELYVTDPCGVPVHRAHLSGATPAG